MHNSKHCLRRCRVPRAPNRCLARSLSAEPDSSSNLRLVLFARQESAVDAATEFFTALGAVNVHHGAVKADRRSLYVSSSRFGHGSIDVITDASHRWAWPDRQGQAQEMLRVIAAGPWGSSGEALSEEVLLSLVEPRPSSTGGGGGSPGSLLRRVGQRLGLAASPLPTPRILRQQAGVAHSRSSSGSSDTASIPSSRAQAWSLKEVVLGCEGEAFQHAQAQLEDSGPHVVERDRKNLSLWRIGASNAPRQGIRLLPSRYSAIVLGQGQAEVQQSAQGEGRDTRDAQLEQAQQAIQAACHAAGPLGQQVRVREYGTRRGHGGSGQLRVTAPFLHGLDVRVCSLPPGQHAMFFSERHEAMSDHIDPDMNPGWDAPQASAASASSHAASSADQAAAGAGGRSQAGGDGDERLATALAKKQKSLACNSVVGMEVVGLLKHKLGIQQ